MALNKVQITLPPDLLEFANGLIDGQDFICIDDVAGRSRYRGSVRSWRMNSASTNS